jgi:hypothetical protein
VKRLIPVVLALLIGCWRAPPEPPPVPERIEAAGLHNVFRVGPLLFSGSSPDGEAGFASLHRLGVRTVLSVDGAVPDVAGAKKYGLRYVHVPVGYDGVPRDKALTIAKAVRDLPGPVYVHCHHGLHRGPAAAACALLVLEPGFAAADGEAWLRAAGTDPRYRGLVELPRIFVRPTAEELARTPSDFPETAAVPTLTALMVRVDEHWESLKAARAKGWPSPPESAPDAVQLVEHYREAGRIPAVAANPSLQANFRESEGLGRTLERALAGGDVSAIAAAFAGVQKSCTSCHAKHRDVPR